MYSKETLNIYVCQISQMKRRNFLKRLAQYTSAFTLSGQSSSALSVIFTSNYKLNALPYFLDMLIPEDISPSASQLRLHEKLILHANGIENYSTLLELGCQWLDANARMLHQKEFRMLSEKEKFNIVLKAEGSLKQPIPQLFFDRVKNDIFVFYYSHPDSWQSLGINLPPQPLGYLNYVVAPKILS